MKIQKPIISYSITNDYSTNWNQVDIEKIINFLIDAKHNGANALEFNCSKDYEGDIDEYELTCFNIREETEIEAFEREERKIKNIQLSKELKELEERREFERLKLKFK